MARTARIGPVTFFQLLARFGTACTAFENLPRVSAQHSKNRLPSRDEIESEWQSLRSIGADVVCAIEPDYPALLKQLDPPPPVLVVRGDLQLGQRRTVAIVGARQASAVGRKLARDIATDLADAGFVTVSGLARGIDGEAHAASLATGTIAVLGGGIDHIYPSQHQRLYDAICEQGLTLSESPFGYRATARDFPRRNRIVTGLSEGVVLIEAAERSGSLISARTAAEQNREVFAIPGSPVDPRYEGSNRLLRDGATLVRNADDIMEVLNARSIPGIRAPAPPHFSLPQEIEFEIPEKQILAVQLALTATPVLVEQIADAARIGVPRCAAILAELELAGVATTYPGGLASLAIS